jgi:hypothetical protein
MKALVPDEGNHFRGLVAADGARGKMIERPQTTNEAAAMRAVWYDQQGAADEVLVCGELPTPEAGYGEVRVRLEASGVNPSDTYRRRGPPAMEFPRVVTNRRSFATTLLKKSEVQSGFRGPVAANLLAAISAPSDSVREPCRTLPGKPPSGDPVP